METLLAELFQLLFNLVNWEYFTALLLIWLVLLIIYSAKAVELFNRFADIIQKPIIFNPDPNPDSNRGYPRTALEGFAVWFKDGLAAPLTNAIASFNSTIRSQWNLVYEPRFPIRTIGYVIFFGAFVLLVLSDIIVAGSTLRLLGFNVPTNPILDNFGIAVFAGSIIALIVGIVIYGELRASNSQISTWSLEDEESKRLPTALALLSVLLSGIVLAGFAFFRLEYLDVINTGQTGNIFVNAILYGVVPINSAISAALCFRDGIRGILLAALVVEAVAYVLLVVLNGLLTFIGSVFPFLLDFTWRLVYILIDILIWFLTTPIQAILLPFQGLFRMLTGG